MRIFLAVIFDRIKGDAKVFLDLGAGAGSDRADD